MALVKFYKGNSYSTWSNSDSFNSYGIYFDTSDLTIWTRGLQFSISGKLASNLANAYIDASIANGVVTFNLAGGDKDTLDLSNAFEAKFTDGSASIATSSNEGKTITLKGGVAQSSGSISNNGSDDVVLTFTTAPTESNAIVTADDIKGITGVMHFKGAVSAAPTSGTDADGNAYEKGDIVIVSSTSKEYVFDGTNWVELGDESSYVQKNSTVSGTSVADQGVSVAVSNTYASPTLTTTVTPASVTYTAPVEGGAAASLTVSEETKTNVVDGSAIAEIVKYVDEKAEEALEAASHVKTTVTKGTGNGTISVDSGSDITIYSHPTQTAHTTSAVYKFTNDATGHIDSATAATSADITSIIGDNVYEAYDANIVSDADYKHITVTASSVSDGTTTFNKTTVAEGKTNGTVSVDGSDVAVHGLSTAAYATVETTALATGSTSTNLPTSSQVVTYADSLLTWVDLN